MNPCGNQTTHTQRIGCCSGCRRLFSSDSSFDKHRKRGQCLTPESVGLVAKDSRTAPGEVIWTIPAARTTDHRDTDPIDHPTASGRDMDPHWGEEPDEPGPWVDSSGHDRTPGADLDTRGGWL